MFELLTKALPLIAAILYAITAIGYIYKKEYAWGLVWFSYSAANVGLVLAAMGTKE